MLALGILAGAASAAPSRSTAANGHLVFSEQAPPCGFVCDQQLMTVAGDASGEEALTTGTIDSAPAWSPNGKLIAFWRTVSSGQAQLHVMSSAGGGDRILLPSVPQNSLVERETPTWSADGRSVLIIVETYRPFYGVTLRGWGVLAVSLAPHPKLNHAKVTRLFHLPGGSDQSWSDLRLSPNGKWLALGQSWYGHDGSETASLYLVHPNRTDLHKIAGFYNDAVNTVELQAISWSPNSSRLAFVAVPDVACSGYPNNPPPALWTVNVLGKNVHGVWTDSCEAGNWVAPDTIAPGGTTTWSPDGTEILYSTGYQLHEANASTGAIQTFPVTTGDCGSGPGSCKIGDPQWTAY